MAIVHNVCILRIDRRTPRRHSNTTALSGAVAFDIKLAFEHWCVSFRKICPFSGGRKFITGDLKLSRVNVILMFSLVPTTRHRSLPAPLGIVS